MRLGAEPKKVILLAGLGLVAAYLIVSDMIGNSPSGGAPHRPRPSVSAVRAPAAAPRRVARRPPARRGYVPSRWRRFQPSLKPRGGNEHLDPMTIDPTLRLDLLAKLQQVQLGPVKRSLFDFSAAPPKAPEPKLPPAELAKIEAQRKKASTQAAARKSAVKPAPPPIPLKFYGFIRPVHSNRKRAFFLEGRNVFVAGEGEPIGKHYKLVRIDAHSAVVQDLRGGHRRILRLEKQKG